MAFTTPKVDFVAADGFAYTDTNKTNENIRMLAGGDNTLPLSTDAATGKALAKRDADGDIAFRDIAARDIAAQDIAASGNVGAATISSTGAISANGGISENAITIRRKVIEIGAWNMDSASSVSIAHGLTLSKIIRVTASIYNDTQTMLFDFNYTAEGYYTSGNQVGIVSDATYIVLKRSGWFDNSSYDSIAINRGYVEIDYIA